MQAAIFYGPRDVRLIDIATPSPQAGEALVKVQRAGICGSDVNRFRHGSHPWPPGFIMGHEFCGEIVALEPDVSGLQLGAQVVVEPTLYCGACAYCRQGYHNRCVDFVRRGLTGSGPTALLPSTSVCPPINRMPAPKPCPLRSLLWLNLWP
jgi:threonine dehydrogenase-like Zn-dependent dehydrogenase